MFLRGAGKTLRMGTSTFEWFMNPLLFKREIGTSNPVYARRMPKFSRNSSLSEKEMDDFLQQDPDEMSSASLEELQHHIDNIESEAVKHQQFIQQKTIKHKYFKVYEPAEENLLTWEMKEQLKYLHHTDPDEWTPEALSVAFPVSPNGVKKLLRSTWVPENEREIERHDKAVIQRWRRYTNGRLGSAKLLELLVRKRLGQDTQNLPAPLMDPEKIMSTLESLRFENEEKPNIPSASTEKKLQLKKKPKIRSGSFVSIIENYESQVSPKEPTQKNESDKNLEILDVSSVIPSTPEYEGTYCKIRSKNPSRNSRRKVSRNMITFDEFMKGKGNS